MSNILSQVMLQASKAAYSAGATDIPAGYVLDTEFNQGTGILVIADTGFKAIALKSTTTGERILAFAGTEDLVDAFQDVKLGWDQWDTLESNVRGLTPFPLTPFPTRVGSAECKGSDPFSR